MFDLFYLVKSNLSISTNTKDRVINMFNLVILVNVNLVLLPY